MSRMEGALRATADELKGRDREDTGRAKRDASMMDKTDRKTFESNQGGGSAQRTEMELVELLQ